MPVCRNCRKGVVLLRRLSWSILPTAATRRVTPGSYTSAATAESKKWAITGAGPPSSRSLPPGPTTRRPDRCSSRWITAERATATRCTFSSRMWPSSWWGQTPGWTRDKRRIQAGRQRGPESKRDHIRAGSSRTLTGSYGWLKRGALPLYRDGIAGRTDHYDAPTLNAATRLVAGQY